MALRDVTFPQARQQLGVRVEGDDLVERGREVGA
jgi:hypothetical protein